MLSRGLRAAFGSVVALVMTLGASGTARADLQVERADGADSCPDTASFAKRMHEGGVGPASGAVDVRVRFEQTANGYRSHVIMADGKQRSLTDVGPSCDGLAEATILAVKLALDLERPLAVTPTITPAAAASREAPDVPSPAPLAPLASPFAEVSATGVLAFGIATPVASGVRAGAALVLGGGRWSMGITGLVLPSQTREIGVGTVNVSILGGGIEGCGRLPAGRTILFGLCGRLEAMGLKGRAQGFDRAEAHTRPLFAGTLLGRARARIAGPVAAFVEAGGVVPFARERFAIDTVGVVYDPPIVALATGIGILVDFE